MLADGLLVRVYRDAFQLGRVGVLRVGGFEVSRGFGNVPPNLWAVHLLRALL